MRVGFLVVLAGLLAAGAPAAAQTCTTGVDAYCDALEEAEFDRLFGDYADVAVLYLALFLVIALIAGFIALVRRPATSPRLRATARQEAVEIGPGGSVQLLADVENPRNNQSVDVVAEWDELPPEWGAQTFAALAYPSGFTAPQLVTQDQPLHLSSERRGAHRATMAVQLTAPEAVAFDESVEVPIRLVPVTGGVRRVGRAKTVTYQVHLTTRQAAVEIQDVKHAPSDLVAGRPVRTVARLFNGGDMDAQNVNVSLHLNDEALEEKVVPHVPAHQDTSIEFEWVPRAGENRVRISVA